MIRKTKSDFIAVMLQMQTLTASRKVYNITL